MDSESNTRVYHMSDHCKKVYNPIRHFIEKDIEIIRKGPLPATRPQDPVNVSYGDPCAYTDFKPIPEDLETLSKSVGKYDGYVDFRGMPEVRQYLRDHYNNKLHFKITENDVYITHGCSLALWLAINVLAEEGDNILTPKPGFPLSSAIAISQNIEVRHYDLLPEDNWKIDLVSLEKQINSHTKLILINNPSNPTGGVFSKAHIEEILEIAYKYKLPILADEVYEDMVYPGEEFFSFGSVTRNVPVFICGGLSKKNFAPGWRTGWLILSGPSGVFDDVKVGLESLMSILMNSNTICMQHIPNISNTHLDFLKERMGKMQNRMKVLEDELKDIECYTVLKSKGAMYGVILVKVDMFKNIENTIDFCKNIFREQNVLCFPGELFDGKNFVRVVSCSDESVLKELSKRMKVFYEENKKK